MKYIMLKTFRDIRETIGSFISIVAVIIIGCFFFAGITAGSAAITNQVYDYYSLSNYATSRAEYMYVNSTAVAEIAAESGVKKAAGYNTFHSQTAVGGKKIDLTVTTLTDGIDEPTIVSGAMPAHGEILVDTVAAERHNINIGDTLDFDIATLKTITLEMNTQNSGEQTAQYTTETESVKYGFKVSGIYHSPDVIYKVNVRNTSALPDEFITAYVNMDDIDLYTEDAEIVLPPVYIENVGLVPVVRTFEDVTKDVDVFNGIKIIGTGNLDTDKLFERYSLSSAEDINAMFADTGAAAGLYMYKLDRENFPSVTAFNSLNDTIAALAGVLPFMFFAVAAAITIISLSKTVDNQRMQIGVIQAIGVSKGSIYFSYIFYALFACIIGGVVGGGAGILFVPWLMNFLYLRQFSMPPTPQHVSVLFLILGIAVAAALACLAAFLSCHHTLKIQPAQAMRPKPPKKTKRILAERWTGLWKRLGFGTKMNLRNMFLHKLRMLLSSVGIIGCIALLIGLIGLKDNMDFSFDGYDKSVGYDLTVSINAPVDLETFDIAEISDRNGVEYLKSITFVPSFSGRFELDGKTADMTVMALPRDLTDIEYADPDCIKIYTDISGENRVTFDENTFAIPTALADKLGAKVGDTVRVTGYALDNHSVDMTVTVTHIVYEYFEQKAYCSYKLFTEKGVGLFADTAYISVTDGTSLETAIEILEGYDGIVRDVRSFATVFESLKDKMSLLDYAVILFVIGAAVLAVAVIYNITATNLKERTREIATLMVLGYKQKETAAMIIVENLVITLIGCAIGLPLGYGLMLWLIYISSSFNVFISSFLSWYVAIGCMLLTFAFSLIATLMFNIKIKNISMVEALKSVE